MKNIFAKRVKNIRRSFTRKILDVAGDDNIISFAGGLPDELMFPHNLIKKEINHTLNNMPKSIYQYSKSIGIDTLREELARNYKHSKADEILITTGSQQGIDLLCKTFIDEGDTIIVEAPSYLAALSLFSLYDANIEEVSLTCGGVNIHELEHLFKRKKPKFFYTIPTFQNPTGRSWDEECKHAVANLAKKYNVLIVEDSPYNKLRYEGEEGLSFEEMIPALSITLGTFSKTLAPDFRLGWIRANKKILTVLQNMKENTDLQSSKFFQYIVADIIHSGEFDLHVEVLKKSYKKKRDIMAKALNDELLKQVKFEIPKGGMFFWIQFNSNINTMKLFDIAIKEKVTFIPGSVFYKNKHISSYARINFTNPTCENIIIGIKRLKIALSKY